MLRMAKAGCTRDTRKVLVRANQAALRILYSQVQYVPMRGRPGTLLEGPEEVTLAQPGNTTQIFERNRLGQANLDVLIEPAQHPGTQAAARDHLLRVSDLGDPRQMS